MGTPIVLKTEHDALLARVAALEARLAKAKL
jgi:BMFP domain-containing protein YqiC